MLTFLALWVFSPIIIYCSFYLAYCIFYLARLFVALIIGFLWLMFSPIVSFIGFVLLDLCLFRFFPTLEPDARAKEREKEKKEKKKKEKLALEFQETEEKRKAENKRLWMKR